MKFFKVEIRLIDYDDSKDIFGFESQFNDNKVFVSDEARLYDDVWEAHENKSEDNKTIALRLETRINPSVLTIYRRPITILEGLAKIGGLIGFLKILKIFIEMFHERFFIDKLQKELDTKAEILAKDLAY
jgi:hypothetical protein